MWSKKEQRAVEFSFKAHKGQKRKGTKIAYISHPMIVGLILARISNDQDLIIAGILHDVIEDTEYDKATLEEKFGKRVANLVEEVSEDDKSLSYNKRKNRAAQKMISISDQAILIKAADVISNTTDLILRLEDKGSEAFQIFNTDKRNKIKQTEKVIKILIERVDNQELTIKLKNNLKKIKQYED